VKKIYLEILMDLHVFSIREYEKVGSGMASVCMYMFVRLARASTVEQILFILCIYDFIHITGLCPVNMNILASKIGALHRGPQTQNPNFLKKDSN
jgi:hypothetical protein